MVKQIGKLQINKNFLRFLDRDTKKLFKQKIWNKINIISVDCDTNNILTIHAESKELFNRILIGKMKIPSYNIVLETFPDGRLSDINIKMDNKNN